MSEDFSAGDAQARAKDKAFDDLQNELAGRDVGRQTRFFVDSENNPRSEKKDEKHVAAVQRALSALEQMLRSDADYAAHYQETHEKLSLAEMTYTSAHMEASRDAMTAISERMAIQDRAGILDDGTRVYRSETGDVYTEEGRRLDDAEVADVTWKDGSDSWESYQEATDKVDEARARMQSLETYNSEVLQPARDRMEDHDNPITRPEMDQIQSDIVDRASPAIKSKIDVPGSEIAPSASGFDVATPKIS